MSFLNAGIGLGALTIEVILSFCSLMTGNFLTLINWGGVTFDVVNESCSATSFHKHNLK